MQARYLSHLLYGMQEFSDISELQECPVSMSPHKITSSTETNDAKQQTCNGGPQKACRSFHISAVQHAKLHMANPATRHPHYSFPITSDLRSHPDYPVILPHFPLPSDSFSLPLDLPPAPYLHWAAALSALDCDPSPVRAPARLHPLPALARCRAHPNSKDARLCRQYPTPGTLA